MGYNIPEIRVCDAEIWIEVQEKYLYGTCKSTWHKLFYKSTATVHSKEKPDGSSATLYLCAKCNGLREALVTIKL